MNREEMLALRTRLIKGDPPYEVDQMGNKRRDKGGIAGLDERRALGDANHEASGVRLALDSVLKLTEHLLERMR